MYLLKLYLILIKNSTCQTSNMLAKIMYDI